MARSSTRKRPSASAAPEGVNPKAPCPCGSGRRYKHCHGSTYAPPVTRPFEGLPGEADWVALRELVPAATATIRTTGGREATLASVLPGGTPALVRANGDEPHQEQRQKKEPESPPRAAHRAASA